ncbi:nucleolar protein 12 isoform X1 [Elephas maximus indicus]|uniref:nucleolar protein 12 isoform X1 n=1 Tax=Elephas maximus indicus TaxID=99487 RepID=UPI00211615A5|nr:nucleolar protein 12 isoform X1 [Elephas maximus indicus]
MGRNKKKKRDGDDRRPRLVLSFDEDKRREYLTGFHKRKVERKKAAIEELKQRLKAEQKKLREERHQEYLKMLAEREEALDEADELDRLVTAKTESVQYDHPNHTVTVTTISDLDLSGARLLGLPPPEQRYKQMPYFGLPEGRISLSRNTTRILLRSKDGETWTCYQEKDIMLEAVTPASHPAPQCVETRAEVRIGRRKNEDWEDRAAKDTGRDWLAGWLQRSRGPFSGWGTRIL